MVVNILHVDQEKISRRLSNAKHFVVPAFHVCVGFFFSSCIQLLEQTWSNADNLALLNLSPIRVI